MRSPARRASPKPTIEKIAFVEGLRGVAALYVVLGHFRSMVDPSELAGKASTAPDWLRILLQPFAYGHLAVAAFIVLSGFCLQTSLFNGRDGRLHDSKRFFARRAWRILPAYYACLALSVVVCWTVTSRQTTWPFLQYVPVDGRAIVSHLLLVHNFDPALMYKINGVLWSIALEAQLYLLFPLLVALIWRAGRFLTVSIAALAACVILGLFPDAIKLYPWYLPLFAAGMSAAHFAYRPHPRLGPQPALGWGFLVFGLSLCFFAKASKLGLPVADTGLGIAVAAMVYLGTVRPTALPAKLFGWKRFVALGGFSYSLYLLHHPIEQILFVYRPSFVASQPAQFFYLLIVGLPVILMATWTFSLAFERPFIRRGARRLTVAPADFEIPLSLPLKTMGPKVWVDYVQSRRTPTLDRLANDPIEPGLTLL